LLANLQDCVSLLNVVVFLFFLLSEILRLSRLSPSARERHVNSVAQHHMAFVSQNAGLCFDIKHSCEFFCFLLSKLLRLLRLSPSALKRLVNSVAPPHTVFVSRIARLHFVINAA
jgi:hypothetical protein